MTENIESSFLVEQTFKAQEILAKTNLVAPTEIMLANDLVEDQEDTLWISSEIHQVIKAYKIRGAANAAIQLAANERCLALVTASAGNHAQAVALMANELNVPASIIMPSNTPEYPLVPIILPSTVNNDTPLKYLLCFAYINTSYVPTSKLNDVTYVLLDKSIDNDISVFNISKYKLSTYNPKLLYISQLIV
jgi:hypothetical protein